MKKLEPDTLVGMSNGITALKESLVVSQKVNPAIPVLGIHPKELKAGTQILVYQ